jgi:hypothetical protein
MNKIDLFNKNKDCFVGLRYSANYTDPSSTVFINDLPGMSLKRFSSTASNEVHRGEDLFKQIHDEAIQDVINDFTSELSEYFNFNHTVARRKIGLLGSTFGDVTKDIKRGVLFEKLKHSETQLLRVKSIGFVSDLDVDDCNFFVETAAGTTEYIFNVKAGRNKILIDVESNEDFIYVYTTNCYNIANESILGCGCGSVCDNCSYCSGNYYARPYTEAVEGVKVFVDNNFMEYNISTVCDDSELICEFVPSLNFAVRMKIAIKIMTEVLISDGVHPMVRNSKEDARLLLTKWQGGTDFITGFEEKSEYKKLLETVTKKARNYTYQTGGVCVACNQDVKYFESTP